MPRGLKKTNPELIIAKKNRLGFFLSGGGEWLGGLYYLKSLHANLQGNPEFVRNWETLQIGGECGDLETRKRIQRKPPRSLKEILWRYRCDAVFPYTPSHGLRLGAAKAIGWIYDLQHKDMARMFDESEIRFRNKYFQRTLANTSLTLVSSRVMKDKLASFFPRNKDTVRVLHFSANISPEECHAVQQDKTIEEDEFFICPYQLWKHKNHQLLLEALEICKKKGSPQRLLCTGDSRDFRNPDYPSIIKEKVRQMGLSENLIFTGRLSRKKLLAAMIKAKAMVLPSLYEGWSTVLEECKALGQNCLASDLPVHREQNYTEARYFRPNQPEELAELMLQSWQPPSPKKVEEKIAEYQKTRKSVGEKFFSYLKELNGSW